MGRLATRAISRLRAPSRSVTWLVLAALLTVGAIVLSMLLTTARRDYASFDIYDEESHYAYVVALLQGHVPAYGDRLTLGDLRMTDCLGYGGAGHGPSLCGAPPKPLSHYWADGYDYEAQQPPIGYLPYLLTTDANVQPMSGVQATNAIISAREGGLIWIGISGALLLWFAALDNLSLLGLVALLFTCLLNPIFTNAAATVTNDSAGVAVGAACLIAWLVSTRRKHRVPYVAIAVGLAIGLTKVTDVVVPLALLIGTALIDRRDVTGPAWIRSFVKKNLAMAALFFASVVGNLVWVFFQTFRGTASYSTVENAVTGFAKTVSVQPSTIGSSFEQLVAVFQPFFVNGPVNSPVNVMWGIAAFGVIIGLVCLPEGQRSDIEARIMATGAVAGVIALAVGFPVVTFLQGHYNEAADTRYAIPLLPLIGLAIARGTRRFGAASVGILFPFAAAMIQLTVLKY
jgi:hypothetical protein